MRINSVGINRVLPVACVWGQELILYLRMALDLGMAGHEPVILIEVMNLIPDMKEAWTQIETLEMWVMATELSAPGCRITLGLCSLHLINYWISNTYFAFIW